MNNLNQKSLADTHTHAHTRAMRAQQINVLVACEESQTVCKAFRKLGFNAFSADLQKCSGGHPEWHIMGDVKSVLHDNAEFKNEDGTRRFIHHWHLIIAHPPCTYLSMVSASTFKGGINKHPERLKLMRDAAEFFKSFFHAPADYIAIENPVPLHAAQLPRPTTMIQPYHFGAPWSKRTCLWLINLPPLMPTIINPDHKSWTWFKSGSKNRSKTFPEVAQAMATQWGDFILKDIKQPDCHNCLNYEYYDDEIGWQCSYTFNPPCEEEMP